MKVDWSKYDHLLGTMSDAKLAQKIGCTAMSVAKRRQVRGVRSWLWTKIAGEVKAQKGGKDA